MSQTQTRQSLSPSHPLWQLLHQPVAAADIGSVGAAAACEMARLERRGSETVRAARDAGVEIAYLGIAPLFSDPRFYEGTETDWVLAPVDSREKLVVPGDVRRDLNRQIAAGINPRLLFEAHEVPKNRTESLRAEAAVGRRALSQAQAEDLVGPVPPPAASVALGERLARRSTQIVQAAQRSLRVAGTAAVSVVTVPAGAVAGVLASVATLDPIILGAEPASSERVGAPAAWFALAKWDWVMQGAKPPMLGGDG